MNIILITTLVIMAIGLVVGAGLVFTGKKFAVAVDEREVAVREKLPGNNCSRERIVETDSRVRRYAEAPAWSARRAGLCRLFP